jgi:tripartite-type tricarboxylate transporter receptor subunit TctC
VWLPAAAPPTVVDKLAALIDPFVASDANRDYTNKMGNAPWTGVHGDALRQYTVAEIAKWGEAIRLAKIEPQ